MLFRFHGRCLDCGHEWDALLRRIACGRIDFHDSNTYRCYRCARCAVDLYLPRQQSRAGWLRWVSQNASELTQAPLRFTASELGVGADGQSLDVICRSPSLYRAAERVSRLVSGATSRYLPVPIDIGTLDCADCGDLMAIRYPQDHSLVCPSCKYLTAVSTSEHHAGVVLVDYAPIAPEEVRRVIFHLKVLAEPLTDAGSKSLLALPAFEGIEPLWDRQLDS